MLIWCHAPPTTLAAAELKHLSPEQLEYETLKGLIEKRTAINLVEAFAVATKVWFSLTGVAQGLTTSF